MKKTIGAIAVATAILVGAAYAADNYYVNFYLNGQLVGQGLVHCADQPFEYILQWGSDYGEMVVIGRENCPSLWPFF